MMKVLPFTNFHDDDNDKTQDLTYDYDNTEYLFQIRYDPRRHGDVFKGEIFYEYLYSLFLDKEVDEMSVSSLKELYELLCQSCPPLSETENPFCFVIYKLENLNFDNKIELKLETTSTQLYKDFVFSIENTLKKKLIS